MTDVAGGSGDAFDAAVDTTGVAPTEDRRAIAEGVVAAARRKVEKQRDHLAGAEYALAEAEAALADLEEGS